MSTLIYVETSIPSFYHETRPETKFQAMRDWTREWWDIARVRDEFVTSEAVLLELGRAPKLKCADGLALLEPLPLLDKKCSEPCRGRTKRCVRSSLISKTSPRAPPPTSRLPCR